MIKEGFDTEKYLAAQNESFQASIARFPGAPHLIEFGGKPFDDQHAARVLPGYKPDTKAEVLKGLMPNSNMVMVVNARDVLKPPDGRYEQGRIRGDSQLFYNEETVRLILRGRDLGMRVDEVVISITPHQMADQHNMRILDDLQNKLAGIGVSSRRFYQVPNYPSTEDGFFERYVETFEKNGQILRSDNKGIVAFSPGGGSGKFGVLLSEAYFLLLAKKPPNYIKFETFPVFDRDYQHPLNLAFIAATADLNNRTVSLGKDHTTYDKDIENWGLLLWLYLKMGYPNATNHIQDPTKLGINQISAGITNAEVVTEACREEIDRRVNRYEQEINRGIESSPTLEYSRKIRAIFTGLYPKPEQLT